ncbi:hypothetical protein SPRG_00861 [Saprolegnia parasitica CBS 223.65]|uniref:Uncharacterized protein n=1 Tax=Saprolegnia parasitica (strain CBS 223.65) TaxID=695850 RepID=A0A067CZW7_SAPPC|nr:hypothetical protein SPRG_00861 [Saprolegnia parasitica CBS 223.65]KDO34800.1 hypothetical protein SPRG_00861 [Saprolegnia parasitica CBS 223.65]|eukprot:XP_012194467.1 hypothetical protein SPRG_00861 [Saprolegnia parasitica CBS 223.65]
MKITAYFAVLGWALAMELLDCGPTTPPTASCNCRPTTTTLAPTTGLAAPSGAGSDDGAPRSPLPAPGATTAVPTTTIHGGTPTTSPSSSSVNATTPIPGPTTTNKTASPGPSTTRLTRVPVPTKTPTPTTTRSSDPKHDDDREPYVVILHDDTLDLSRSHLHEPDVYACLERSDSAEHNDSDGNDESWIDV